MTLKRKCSNTTVILILYNQKRGDILMAYLFIILCRQFASSSVKTSGNDLNRLQNKFILCRFDNV